MRNDANKDARQAEITTAGENRRKKVNLHCINQIEVSDTHTAEIDKVQRAVSSQTASGASPWSLFRKLFGGASVLTVLWVGYCFAVLKRRPVIIIERGDQADKETEPVASELREDMQEVLADTKEIHALAGRVAPDQRPSPSPLSLLPPPSPQHASVQRRKEKASVKDYTLDGTQAFLRQSLAKYGYQEDVLRVTVVHDQVMKHELLTVECELPDKYFKFDNTFDLFKDAKWKRDVAEATLTAMGKFEPEVSIWSCATGTEAHSARELLRARPSLLAALLVIGAQPDGTVPKEVERQRQAWKPSEWSLIQAEVAVQHALSLAPNQRGPTRSSVENAIKYLNSAQHDPSLSKFTLLQVGTAYWLLLDLAERRGSFPEMRIGLRARMRISDHGRGPAGHGPGVRCDCGAGAERVTSNKTEVSAT